MLGTRISKIHEDYTATVRAPEHGLCTEAARALYDIRAISMPGCRDSLMTARSHDLSTALNRSVEETRQRNRTMAVLMYSYRP